MVMGKGVGAKKITEKQLAANRANAVKGGRPAGKLNPATIARAALVEEFREKVAAYLAELLELSMANARGIKACEMVDPETQVPVGIYTTKPDQRAIDSLISRIVGDPPKQVTVDGNMDTVTTVIHQYSK